MEKIKIITTIIILVLFISNIVFIVKEQKFPIKYMICDVGYVNCFIDAKFNDISSCQNAVEKGNWYCDSTNPDNIQCRVAKPNESIATSFCTK